MKKLCDFYTAEDNTCDIDKECFLLCQGEMRSDKCLFCVKDLDLYKKVVNERNLEYVKQYYNKMKYKEDLQKEMELRHG